MRVRCEKSFAPRTIHRWGAQLKVRELAKQSRAEPSCEQATTTLHRLLLEARGSRLELASQEGRPSAGLQTASSLFAAPRPAAASLFSGRPAAKAKPRPSPSQLCSAQLGRRRRLVCSSQTKAHGHRRARKRSPPACIGMNSASQLGSARLGDGGAERRARRRPLACASAPLAAAAAAAVPTGGRSGTTTTRRRRIECQTGRPALPPAFGCVYLANAFAAWPGWLAGWLAGGGAACAAGLCVRLCVCVQVSSLAGPAAT